MDFEELFLSQNTEKEELPLFTEYAIDLDTLEPLKNGDRLAELNGNEALKVWIFKALKTKRNFCLLVNTYILNCYNFELNYNNDDNNLKVSFNVSTVYGESEVLYSE